MKREKYLDVPVVVREENDVSGKKRVWVQVTETRAEMIKLDGNAKKADIGAAAEKRLADLKEIQAKEIELEELEAAAAALRAQLGIE
jgi:hypothetical protein